MKNNHLHVSEDEDFQTEKPSTAETFPLERCGMILDLGGKRLYCELCGSFANAFCHSDEALLCQSCDSNVHKANFLASRHIRTVLCSSCSSDTTMKVSGPNPPVFPALCSRCHCSYHGVNWMQPCVTQFRGPITETSDIIQSKRSFQMTLARERLLVNPGTSEQRSIVPQRISPLSVLSADRCSSLTCEDRSNSSTPLTPGRQPHQCSEHKRQKQLPFYEETEEETSPERNNSACDYSEENGSCPETPEVVTSKLRRMHEDSSPSSEGSNFSTTLQHKKSEILGVQATARLKRVLASWHQELGLSGDDTCALAFHLFKRVLKKVQPGKMAADSLRGNLAACLWVATKFDEHQTAVRKAPEVSTVSGVHPARLVELESQILNMLNWRPLEGWNRPSDERMSTE